VPLDLAPGIDYQVVVLLNTQTGSIYSSMAVNPAAASDVQAFSSGGVSSGAATDNPATPLTNAMVAYGLRQRVGEGIMQMDNLEVSLTGPAGPGSGAGYTAVTTGITPSLPVIGLQPVGTTNYSGNAWVMEVAASGIGTAGTGLTYAWYRNNSALSDGADVTGSATPTLTLNSLAAIDDGTYYVLVTGAGSTPTATTLVSVNTTITAPSFTAPGGVEPPASASVSEGDTVTFTATAVGTGQSPMNGSITTLIPVSQAQLTPSSLRPLTQAIIMWLQQAEQGCTPKAPLQI